MLRVAFKEWAGVCRALADGRQSVILRKGGIAEEGGAFRPEHERFWVYPTYFHEQQQQGLKPEAAALLAAAEADWPEPGTVRLTHFIEVAAVRFVSDLDAALRLDAFHVWTADTVRQRYHYRTPGLFVLAARVYRSRTPAVVAEHPSYAGCKTWVELAEAVGERPAVAVLPNEVWDECARELDAALR